LPNQRAALNRRRQKLRRVLCLGLGWLAVASAASVTRAFAATAPASRLAGAWVLDTAVSDNFDVKLNAFIAATQQRERERRRRRHVADDIERIAGSTEDIPTEATDRTRERLIESFRPATHLNVLVDADSVMLTADSAPARSYALDETATRMDGNGMATIGVRWTGTALVIRSKFTNRALHLQQLSLDRTGNKLLVLLQVKDPASVPLQVSSTYRRQ
jgi:hypothetical protein